MRFSTIVLGLLATVGLVAASPVAVEARAADGKLAFLRDQPLLTFKYSTPSPKSKNWVGIYPASGGGPDKEVMVDPSITWAYAPNADSTVKVPTTGLTAGKQYKAYYLADDGYKWLAEPVTFYMPTEPRALDGKFELLPDQPLLTFKYSIPTANSKNWIGIYPASGGGPDQEKQVNPSLTWAYTPKTDGTVQIAASSLTGGQQYKAYFLANDGYKWLAEPILFYMPSPDVPFEFIVTKFTLQNARVGEDFSVTIAGLLNGVTDPSTVSFEKVSGDAWVGVSSTGGIISGKPTAAGKVQATIKATLAGKGSSTLEVTIPVRRADQVLVSSLNVLTYNLWHGGTQVNDYHRKQVRFLAGGNFDIIGFQESTGDHANRLAKALGWYVYQGQDVGTISRYPIVETYTIPGSYSLGVRIALDGQKQQVNVWNQHLGYDPYGPYDFCFSKMTVEQTLAREAQSGRTPQIRKSLELMKSNLDNANSVPVILLGDFNAPSHLDYTEATRDTHCGYANVPWPTSVEPTNAGMIDSYRVIHPDPLAVPGITWSPIYLDNNGRKEPMDRIDFIYHKGNMTVVDSNTLIVGSPTPEPNHKNNDWTSDHASVHTVFQLPVANGQLCKPRKP
ncbi:uncharacterized protein E0L32_007689 [Thyridium curvatum]|uniref:Endonuclease/exonuclease/phosphatase domain-containing protein n=1 Tax=Thyridium curvatum TaxID=1093900 RepID=A0A507B533_9PEZI|nr:uncharacterized protein E0L32_007689 [Thyridium curvatum]TPX11710.1 hypothetical protein E0L32_007689 [Thyridium curvatum]